MLVSILFIIGLSLCGSEEFYFTETPLSGDYAQNQKVILKCSAAPLEKTQGTNVGLQYGWMRNGVIMPDRKWNSKTNFGSTLVFRRIQQYDAGNYTCFVSSNITMHTIKSPPAVIRVHWLKEAEVSVEVSEGSGEGVTLKCIVQGSPDTKIEWLRNDERILKNDGERISIREKSLQIKNATPADNGVYRCLASNMAGTVSSLKNYILKVPGNGWATIDVVPQDQIIKEGSMARLDCSFIDADVMEWYFKETIGPLDNSTRFSVLSNGSLVVNHFTNIDEGRYSCVGIQQESAEVPQKYTALLYLAYLFPMNSSFLEGNALLDHIVPENTDFQLTCISPVGRPSPVIKWINPKGEYIKSDGRIRVEKQNLIIKNANINEDSGNYTCEATNLAGNTSVSYEIRVASKPEIKNQPDDKIAEEFSSISMTCSFNGLSWPYASIRWIKDKILITENSSRVAVNEQEGTLRITELETRDAGKYTCFMSSAIFDDVFSKPFTLTVTEMLKFRPRPIAKKMELGLPNKIPCKAEGIDTPTVHWFKQINGNTVEEFPEHIRDVNGTLYFKKVQMTDKGNYTCIASNSQGVINVTIDVDVIVKPKFTLYPKNLTEAYEGYLVRMDCKAEGDPVPTIQWDSKVVNLSHPRFHVLENGSLLIDEVHRSDSGTYGCTAGNSGGFNRTSVLLIVRSTEGYKLDDRIIILEGDSVKKTIVITVSAACAYILLVIVLMAWCRIRRRRNKQAYLAANPPEDEPEEAVCNEVELKENSTAQNGDLLCARSDGENTAHSHSSHHSKRSRISNDNSTFRRNNLLDMMLLGEGEFGCIYLAQMKSNDYSGRNIVMVKALEEVRDESALQEFKRQIDLLTHVQHDNLVKLIGLCKEMTPHYMVLEYTDWGDLKQFLVATRKSSVGRCNSKRRPAPLSLLQCLIMARQISSAMECLSDQRHVHRDLAARNCLIDSSLNVKITFSSLCKDTYATEYFEIRNQLIAIRWMPLEVIDEDEYSTKSDVYSFGCLMWEILNKGELPFSKLSNTELLIASRKQQLTLKAHKSIPISVMTVLHKCISNSPNQRPTFNQLSVDLTDIITPLCKDL